MAEFPALPFWTDAYLADCSHLSDAEHGRYLMMLFHMWRMPRARFPNDDGWLARKFGRSLEVFVSEWKPLMQELMQCDGNWWTQKKMQKVWIYVQTTREKKRDAAKSRWDNEKDLYRRNASKTKSKTQKIEDKRVRATRWHPDCVITQNWMDDALLARRRNTLPDINLQLEEEKFRNFWCAKSGANATKLDWHKTWINWVLRAEGPRNGTKQSSHDKFFAGVADAIRDAAGPAENGHDNVVVGAFGGSLLSAGLHALPGKADDPGHGK